MKAFLGALAATAVQAYIFDTKQNLLSMQQKYENLAKKQSNGDFSPL